MLFIGTRYTKQKMELDSLIDIVEGENIFIIKASSGFERNQLFWGVAFQILEYCGYHIVFSLYCNT